jgi:hypothetical protein
MSTAEDMSDEELDVWADIFYHRGGWRSDRSYFQPIHQQSVYASEPSD